MSYKLIFPTFRARQRWVLDTVRSIGSTRGIHEMLNAGCGEGDLDHALRQMCRKLVAIDINEEDVAHALEANGDFEDLKYEVQDAQELSYEDRRFDVVTCLEVIEHVKDPRRLLSELGRVTKHGGSIVITCPSLNFPATYDPINWLLAPTGKHVSIGAYGFGHSWLVREEDLSAWATSLGLEVVSVVRLSKSLSGISECYWPGIFQKLLKANSANQAGLNRGQVVSSNGRGRRPMLIRPSSNEPRLLSLTDWFIDLDARLFAKSGMSVTLGLHLKKP